MALDVTLEDDVIVENNRLLVNSDSVFLLATETEDECVGSLIFRSKKVNPTLCGSSTSRFTQITIKDRISLAGSKLKIISH